MKNKIFSRAIFLFVLLTCLYINKGFACTYCNSELTCEAQFVKITEDKHYIKPGSIVFSEHGLFLVMQGHLIPINCMQKDAGGVFIRQMDYPYGTCPGCGLPLTPGGSCLNSRCPYSPLYDPDYE
jgi:hypothetical protein